MLPKVAIIIVNWNGKADTLECLASLSQDMYPNKQVIMVDNGSADGSVAVIRAAYPSVTVLETGANLGFTGGNNVGINHALEQGTDYVFLLNNDTTVESDALTALVKAAEVDSKYGLLTPVIHYFDKPSEAWFAGSRMDLTRGAAYHDNSRVPARTERPREIPWASGCAMLVRAAIIQELGGFDDRYFLNWEDVDLSLRVRKLGSKIGLVPSSRIYHKVGRSFAAARGAGYYYYVRNNLLLLSIHGGRKPGRAMLRVLAARLRESVTAMKNHEASSVRALPTTINAVQDFLCRRYGPLSTKSNFPVKPAGVQKTVI